MLVGEAKAAARRWVAMETAGIPGFAGAFFHGSTNWMTEDEPFPLGSDLDVMLVLDGPPPATKLGKLVYDGVLLEISNVSRTDLGTAEEILGNNHLAGSFQRPSIIADPAGFLTPLNEAVAREYTRRPWVRARCEHARDKALRNLLSSPKGSLPDQINAWLFPTGITTHMLLVAGLRNPTVRRRYAAARALLHEYGHAVFYETLIDQLDPAAMTPERVTAHLAALSAAFDAAATVIHSPFFFAADITAHARPIPIGGSEELIARGLHREALFWIAATYCRCMAVFAQDGTPELHARHEVGFHALLADLDVATPEALQRRKEGLVAFMPEVWEVAEAIMAANPAITE
jgi:hypothetical protein